MGNLSEQFQIKGIAKGFYASLNASTFKEKMYLHTEVPDRLSTSLFDDNEHTYRLDLIDESNSYLNDELIKESVLIGLKQHIQNVCNEHNLRKIPSEEDLMDTIDLMINQFNKQREYIKNNNI